MENTIVYVVCHESVVDGDSDIIIDVYLNKKTAEAAFKEEVKAARESIDGLGMIIDYDSTYFEAYEDGNFVYNRETVTLCEKEAKA